MGRYVEVFLELACDAQNQGIVFVSENSLLVAVSSIGKPWEESTVDSHPH